MTARYNKILFLPVNFQKSPTHYFCTSISPPLSNPDPFSLLSVKISFQFYCVNLYFIAKMRIPKIRSPKT